MPFFGVPIRNGLPIGLGSVAGFGVQQFDPSQLFQGGTVAGAWYDPSDLSTMFDTSAGTTPVAMPGQGAAVPVGLMLDKSQGLVLGSELVTNGDFSSGTTGWSAFYSLGTGSLVVSGGVATLTAGIGYATAGQSITTVVGKWYRVTGTVTSAPNSGFNAFRKADQLNPATNIVDFVSTNSAITSPTTATGYFLATSTTSWVLFQVNAIGGSISFDNISVRELPGNHAIAFNDTTARPELRARVNLLERSEEFNNAYWTRSGILAFGSGSVVDATTAPDGTVTADLITETATTAVHTIARTGLSLTGSFVYSVSGKTNGRFITLSAFAANGNFAAVTFDLVNGTVTEQSSNGSQAITSAPGPVVQSNGFFRCSVTANFVGVSEIYVCLSDVGNPVALGGQAAIDGRRIYAGNGTSGAYIWGADLRPANIGANVPAYQRIADALTYDTSGFPLYLYFDGTDDGMSFNSLALSDQAIWFGMMPQNGVTAATTAQPLIATSSGDFSSVGFGSVTSTLTDERISWLRGSGGLVYGAGQVSNDFDVAPYVLTFQYATTPATSYRRNAVTQTLTTTSGGGAGGAFTAAIFPTNYGRIAANAALTSYFRGNIYSLIIAGSAVSAGNISATEQWVAGKTGIAI